MEIATIGLFLLGGGAYLRWKPTRAQAWNYIAAWAAENRDAAITREARKREYLAAEVIAAAERERDEAQAHAEDLRGALDLARVQFDWVRQNSKPPVNGYSESSMWAVVVTAGRDASSALVRTPPQSLGRIKAKALKEMARLFMATAKSELSYHNRDLAARFCNAEADRLEATNGR